MKRVLNEKLFYIMSAVIFLLLAGLYSGNRKRIDAKPPYAASQSILSPKLFGEGIISTPDNDLNACFSSDGKTIYFSKASYPYGDWGIILISHWKKGKWTTPETVSFSGQYTDRDPFISPDGKRLFFTSNRHLEGQNKTNYNIWVVEKTDKGWSRPESVGEEVNTENNELYPSVASDKTLYFSSDIPNGRGSYDIYYSKFVEGKYQKPENLGGEINLATPEIESCISPGQDYLIFAGYKRIDDIGGGSGDLYISYHKDGLWTKAKNLGNKINSLARDYCPILSPDGKYLFFSSFRSQFDKTLDKKLNYKEIINASNSVLNGSSNIYQIDISSILENQ